MNHNSSVSSAGASFRRHVDHVLSRRSAERGTLSAKVEDWLKSDGARAWSYMKRHPGVGVTAAGGLALAAAATVGVGEIVVAASAAYAAFQVLREGVPPGEALEHGIETAEREVL